MLFLRHYINHEGSQLNGRGRGLSKATGGNYIGLNSFFVRWYDYGWRHLDLILLQKLLDTTLVCFN